MNKYCQNLRSLREERGLTQAQVARVLNTSQQMYSQYENGVHELPVRHLVALSIYYHVTADFILGLAQDGDERTQEGSVPRKRNAPTEPLSGQPRIL